MVGLFVRLKYSNSLRMRSYFVRTGITLISLFLLVSACDNDVPINAPNEPNAVVYGLLDKGNSVHYIKVNKDFVNENRDARDIAGNRDSILYGDGIRVRLQEIGEGSNPVNTYELFRDTLNNKEPGLFPNPQHVMYRTPEVSLDKQSRYRLIIDQLERQEPVTAETAIVGGVNIIRPDPTKVDGIEPTLPIGFLEQLIFSIEKGDNASFYTLQLNTIVTTIDTADGTTTRDTAEWEIFKQQQPTGAQGSIETERDAQIFFRELAAEFSKAPNEIRPVDSVKANLVISGGTEDLFTFLEVSEPALGIVQKRPEFTNLSDGRGIFASRRRQVFSYVFSNTGKDSLRFNRFTEDLGFVQ